MTTDNDQAAVEALLRVKYRYECSETDDHRTDLAIVNQDAAGSSREAAARAILGAIRKGDVPGVYQTVTYEAQLQVNAELRAEVEREKARADKAEKRLADYDARLTAVMAPDFKCWHQNSRDEWPEVAAWVINNLRQQIEVEKSHADKVAAERDRLAELLRECRNDMINGLTLGEAADLEHRIDAALAEVWK